MYNESDYDRLESGIEKVCDDLKKEVFGDATELDKQDWIQKTILPEFSWLSQLDAIRERVHRASGVPMLHINEHEAEKLLQRLHQEQKRIREQVLNEEYELRQREHILLSFLEP